MVFALCAIASIGYWLGGRRRVRVVDARGRWSARHWRATAFAAGLVLVATTLAEPVDAIVRQAFALRTTQLIVLTMVASPLLVLGAPLPRLRRLLGVSGVARSGRPCWAPWSPSASSTVRSCSPICRRSSPPPRRPAGPGRVGSC